MIITLTGLESILAVDVGIGRYHANRALGIADEKIGPQSNGETDIQGAGAEIAFCKAYNLYPDLQFSERLLADAKFPSGMTVDVKQTALQDGRLLARTTKKDKRCDSYVLVIGELPRFEIVGGYPAKLLFRDCNLANLGHGPTYAIHQPALWAVDQLIEKYNELKGQGEPQ